MALSQPSERSDIHTRTVTCRGYRRADGLWDIEGHLTDVKSYGFANDFRGTIEPGDPIHEMWIRLTVDDAFLVRAIEVVTDKGPFSICPDITANFQCLVGLSIAAGWTRAIKERLGGVRGCTHLVELLGPVATTAFQTVFPILSRERAERRKRHPEEPPLARPVLLDTCHVFDSNGAYVKRHWPEHYSGD
ncbi:MAG: DUF2889 domain-containing protein [Azospirillum sp.]|nr:DUF2889 domain-containing protein [Azospirillum sp.]